MKKNIVVLPGDGIGPDVTAQAVKALRAIEHRFNHKFNLEYRKIGAIAIDKEGVPLSDETVKHCLESDAVILGAIGDPKYDNDPNARVRPEQGLLKLRKELGLHSNIRPIKTYSRLFAASPLKRAMLQNVDFVIFRELTGGIYFGEKTLSEDGSYASDLCAYSEAEIERIAVRAFEMAMLREKRLTLVDKANVLETSRLWRKVVQRLSQNHPEVKVDYLFVDNAAMQVILNPKQFDVILTENMFGDIISDLASVLTGSLGMLPSASIGDKAAMFEPCHGSYPQAAGKDIANPMAAILSVAMMLEHFQMYEEAQSIRDSIDWAFANGVLTVDISPKKPMDCSVVGDLIAYRIEEGEGCKLNQSNIITDSYF